MQDPVSTSKRGVSPWLAASLAVNTALLGVVGGRFIGEERKTYHEAHVERMERMRSMYDRIPDERRRSLRRALVNSWRHSGEERVAIEEARAAVLEAASTENFDKAAVLAALDDLLSAEMVLRKKAFDIILDNLEDAPVDERRAILNEFGGPGGPRRNIGPGGRGPGEQSPGDRGAGDRADFNRGPPPDSPPPQDQPLRRE